ncbi:MAG TPA: ATP-binding protein [Actinocrinis sp.]|nr:ATP-binding protein [Actinocrinis sp.]
MPDSPLIASLLAAVSASPDNAVLRLHLAELMLAEGDSDGAVAQAAAVLQRDPASAAARQMMARAVAGPAASPAGNPAAGPLAAPSPNPVPGSADGPADDGSPDGPTAPAAAEAAEHPPAGPDPAAGPPPRQVPDDVEFDWDAANQQFADMVPPRFADEAPRLVTPEGAAEPVFDLEAPGIRLADVGGMTEVKARLEAAFLAPMRNPELSRLYGKNLKGGLMLYGPPGCGKTFLAKAVAGELGARFYGVTLADVLDMYIGQSEHNLRDIFDVARDNAPCVLFLDEVDALGGKRSQLRAYAAMRGVVNQLLTELDGVGRGNDGVFVLAATNHPWDVDAALLRPGRLDRTLLVLPPDPDARVAILRYHLSGRPIERIDLAKLAKRTDGFSGADLAHLCDSAAEAALMDSARTGVVRMIGMADMEAALAGIKPSIGSWLETAKNVVMFANESGTYDDLLAYLKRRKLL